MKLPIPDFSEAIEKHGQTQSLRVIERVSGHSTRVGATQDLAALDIDIDLAAITQAGGWKSTRMPQQYAEKINAARSGMARAASAAGREEVVPEKTLIGGAEQQPATCDADASVT